MCLIAFVWRAHPRYELILAANRDEFHERPTRAAHWWPDATGVFGGRAERAGGAWCAPDTAGRFAAVTNVREPRTPTGRRSRGELVYDPLARPGGAARYVETTADRRDDYGPFNLLLGDDDDLFYLSNRGATQQVTVAPGVHAVSNGHWGEHWPKTDRAGAALQQMVIDDAIKPEALFSLLADSDPAPFDALPNTGVGPDTEHFLSALFIRSPNYGTRASTVILKDKNGRIDFCERGFDSHARITHRCHEHWTQTPR